MFVPLKKIIESRAVSYVLVMGICFLMFQLYSVKLPERDANSANDRELGGRELQIVYIGSSTCSACGNPVLWENYKKLVKSVEALAINNESVGLAKIGIAVDWNIENGLKHLEDVGEFDEINVGSNWMSMGASKYIWDDITGYAATPQLLITIKNRSASTFGMATQSEELIIRLVGSSDIGNFSKNNMGRVREIVFATEL